MKCGKIVNTMTDITKSKQQWKQNRERSAYGLPTYEAANTVRAAQATAITHAGLAEKAQVKVRRRPTGTFDVLVFDRLPPAKDA